MIAAFIKLKVRPGKKKKLLEYFRWECQVARDEEPHVLRFDVFEDVRDESVVFFYEAFVDEAGFEAHKTYPPFLEWSGGLKDECVETTQLILRGPSTPVCTTAE